MEHPTRRSLPTFYGLPLADVAPEAFLFHSRLCSGGGDQGDPDRGEQSHAGAKPERRERAGAVPDGSEDQRRRQGAEAEGQVVPAEGGAALARSGGTRSADQGLLHPFGQAEVEAAQTASRALNVPLLRTPVPGRGRRRRRSPSRRPAGACGRCSRTGPRPACSPPISRRGAWPRGSARRGPAPPRAVRPAAGGRRRWSCRGGEEKGRALRGRGPKAPRHRLAQVGCRLFSSGRGLRPGPWHLFHPRRGASPRRGRRGWRSAGRPWGGPCGDRRPRPGGARRRSAGRPRPRHGRPPDGSRKPCRGSRGPPNRPAGRRAALRGSLAHAVGQADREDLAGRLREADRGGSPRRDRTPGRSGACAGPHGPTTSRSRA